MCRDNEGILIVLKRVPWSIFVICISTYIPFQRAPLTNLSPGSAPSLRFFSSLLSVQLCFIKQGVINLFESGLLEVVLKEEHEHFTKKAETVRRQTRKGSPWFHANPFDLSSAGGWPWLSGSGPTGFQPEIPMRSGAQPTCPDETWGRTFISKSTILCFLVCAYNRTSSWT